jgi:hypothetical protein
MSPTASSLNVDTLTLSDWRHGSGLPILPSGSDSVTIKHLILHVDGNHKYIESEDFDHPGCEPLWDIRAVTILLHANGPKVAIKRARRAVIEALGCLFNSLFDISSIQITMSPHYAGRNHLCCFPKSLPDIQPSMSDPGIAFRTGCTCGYGNTTGRTFLPSLPGIHLISDMDEALLLNSMGRNQVKDLRMAKRLSG